MQYVVEMLPAKVFQTLPQFVARLPQGELTFETMDWVINRNSLNHFRFGIAEKRTSLSDPLQVQYSSIFDAQGVASGASIETFSGAKVTIVDGSVLRSLLVAQRAHQQAASKTAVETVAWRTVGDVVTVMYVPIRTDKEAATVGGATAAGAEIQYHVDRLQLKLIRTTLAR